MSTPSSPSGIGRVHLTGFAAILALATLLPGCSARSEPPEPVQLGGSYLIEGMVGGRMLRGTLSFPPAGGYVFVTNAAVCDETNRDGVRDLGRQLRRADELVLRCGGFTVEIDFIEGDLDETGLASRRESSSRTMATTCAQFDENGNCIRYNTTTRTSGRQHDGVVRVTPVGDG